MLKMPKFELGKLMEFHDAGGISQKAASDETGPEDERADRNELPVLE